MHEKTPMPGYRGLQHVNIPSADLKRSEVFYCDHLGFARVRRPSFDIDGIWLAAGEGRSIHITRSPQAEAASSYHFAIEVSDLESALQRLSGFGIPYQRGKYVVGAGKQAYLRDPDGNVIEFIERESDS